MVEMRCEEKTTVEHVLVDGAWHINCEETKGEDKKKTTMGSNGAWSADREKKREDEEAYCMMKMQS